MAWEATIREREAFLEARAWLQGFWETHHHRIPNRTEVPLAWANTIFRDGVNIGWVAELLFMHELCKLRYRWKWDMFQDAEGVDITIFNLHRREVRIQLKANSHLTTAHDIVPDRETRDWTKFEVRIPQEWAWNRTLGQHVPEILADLRRLLNQK